MEPSQAEVRRTMLEAGGYWRPLAAVARLLEELGELLELLVRTGPSAGDLASELADLWIIAAAMADQFRIDVAEPQGAPLPATQLPSSAGLVIAAGQIARVINYYDGPKTPRSTADLPTLTAAIATFHDELGLLCSALGIDLHVAVSDKLVVIHGRDMRRFARESSDPSTAATLGLLPEAWRAAKLWGAPAGSPGAGARELVAALAPSLVTFTKAAAAEGLDGYVIASPARAGSAEFDDWLTAFESELRGADPAPGGQPSLPGEVSFNGLMLRLEVIPSECGQGGNSEMLVLLVPREGRMTMGPGEDPRTP